MGGCRLKVPGKKWHPTAGNHLPIRLLTVILFFCFCATRGDVAKSVTFRKVLCPVKLSPRAPVRVTPVWVFGLSQSVEAQKEERTHPNPLYARRFIAAELTFLRLT